jgi:6-phosphofructokinase 2
MAKIITITLNPCIDKTTSLKGLAPEKKLRCTAPQFGPGGGGINVSRAIRNLGGHAPAVYPAGGLYGQFLKKLMDEEGLESEVVEVAANTRENFIVLDTATNQQYRFGMPGDRLAEEEWKALLRRIEDLEADFFVVSGSLMPGMPADLIGQIAEMVEKKGAKLIADTSGEALKATLKVGVFLLKPNLGELSALVGREEISHQHVDSVARELLADGRCRMIAVSMGAYGAKLITSEESIHVHAPMVRRVSTLGAGDSMVAGMTLKLAENRPLNEVLAYGVACGSAATVTHGSELCRKQDVDYLYETIMTTAGGVLQSK